MRGLEWGGLGSWAKHRGAPRHPVPLLRGPPPAGVGARVHPKAAVPGTGVERKALVWWWGRGLLLLGLLTVGLAPLEVFVVACGCRSWYFVKLRVGACSISTVGDKHRCAVSNVGKLR